MHCRRLYHTQYCRKVVWYIEGPRSNIAWCLSKHVQAYCNKSSRDSYRTAEFYACRRLLFHRREWQYMTRQCWHYDPSCGVLNTITKECLVYELHPLISKFYIHLISVLFQMRLSTSYRSLVAIPKLWYKDVQPLQRACSSSFSMLSNLRGHGLPVALVLCKFLNLRAGAVNFPVSWLRRNI